MFDSIGNSQLAKAISDFCSCDIPIIVLGVFNIPDVTRGNTRQSATLFSELFETHGLKHFVTIPTRGESILDLILCSKEDCVSEIAIEVVIMLQLLFISVSVVPINSRLGG